MKVCIIEGCGKVHHGRGWCAKHYWRWRTHGDPLGAAQRVPVEERFWAFVEKSDGCWRWLGSVHPQGYAQFWYDEPSIKAHRYSYSLAHGPIPDGMHIDHVCHNRQCVNPDHLRPATNKQNGENRRGARPDNVSGYRGVGYMKESGKYRARVIHLGKYYHVGVFDTAEEAADAAKAARLELFTHNTLDRTTTKESHND